MEWLKLWKSSKQIIYLKNDKVQSQQCCCNFFYFSPRILNYFVIQYLVLLMKWTCWTQKYGACHKLFNVKLMYSPIMLQELSKFYYRTISEKNDGDVENMEFPWMIRQGAKLICWSRESHEEFPRILSFFCPWNFQGCWGVKIFVKFQGEVFFHNIHGNFSEVFFRWYVLSLRFISGIGQYNIILSKLFLFKKEIYKIAAFNFLQVLKQWFSWRKWFVPVNFRKRSP